MTLTYKANRAGDLQAVYCRACRIGYIENTGNKRWVWTLNAIQPLGGLASGIVASEEIAKRCLAEAWTAWINAAGLQPKADGAST